MARILIVDDQAANRDLLHYLLTHAGHQATATADGSAALYAAQSDTYDLAIIDIAMPGMDGYTLARRMRAVHPNVTLIAVSATSDLTPESAAAAGFSGSYALPLEPVHFIDAIHAVLPAGSAPGVALA
jgi:CheY-like chemotaxis protein